ncbi:MAG: MarR family transcriptional regulator [Anaerolineales bacterium]|nr:MarR family transcriptional regulator [Anaerolineales bacterium]
MSLDVTLGQICRLHYARAHTALEGLGLYRGQPPVLRALWEQDGMTHSELAARVHVQPATITKMIQRMEKAGFVERMQDANDERVSRVILTDAGRAVQADVLRVWQTVEQETFSGLNADELETLRNLLERVRQNLLYVTEGQGRCPRSQPRPGRQNRPTEPPQQPVGGLGEEAD